MRVLDALARAGGLLETADSGGVVLLREGQRRLDYQAMLAHPQEEEVNPRLRPGDVVVVEKAQRRVLVLGSVQQSLAIPYRPGLRLLDAVAMAGGVRPEADLTQASLTRADGQVQTVNLLDVMQRPTTTNNVPLQPGDILFVPPTRQVVVLGAVARPGSYVAPAGARVLDVLGLAGGVRADAGVTTVLLSRFPSRAVSPVSTGAAGAGAPAAGPPDAGPSTAGAAAANPGPPGPDNPGDSPGLGEAVVYTLEYSQLLEQPLGPANLPVAGGDVIYVPEGRRHVLVLGQVRNPGMFNLPPTGPVYLLDVLAMAGGPTPRARLEAVGILRPSGERQQVSAGRGNRLFQGSADQNPPVRPGDIVYVPETRWPDWREIFGIITGINTFVDLIQNLQQ